VAPTPQPPSTQSQADTASLAAPRDGSIRSPRGGLLRPARRPPGWEPPGPAPEPPTELDALWPGPDEDLCWLAGDWRILQRTDGHRFSLDDLATAWTAARLLRERPPRRVLDLGCGIGSVLLFDAWSFPSAHLVGVEAQELSADLARRSIAWNGIGARCAVRLGDLRDPTVLAGEAPFELVTGTPPYFPSGTGLESGNVQRAPARFEHRGGPEDYCLAASRVLAPGAPFVMCAAALQAPRIEPGARAAGLVIERRRDVLPRAGRPALLSIYVLRREGEAGPFALEAPLAARDADGQRSPEMSAVRAEMGMPP
jgi:tRNA1(Val) A37 N6-methylase TrmN6